MARRLARARLGILFALALIPTVASAPVAAASDAPSASEAPSRPATATADERFYLSLVNCSRTGGWVNTNGSCSDRGSGRHSRYVAPLRMNVNISVKVSRPYAKRIADAGYLSHSLGGSPSYRMNRAGFSSPVGESLGASSTASRAGLIRVHRLMQDEARYNGPHWKNLKDPRFKSMGIGIRYQTHGSLRAWIANEFWHGG